eukprot:4624146-Pyramimonas_sp.AAC.1
MVFSTLGGLGARRPNGTPCTHDFVKDTRVHQRGSPPRPGEFTHLVANGGTVNENAAIKSNP